ncbi:MAG: tol-pal system YbgF family protein [Saprospiraceae bacterium]
MKEFNEDQIDDYLLGRMKKNEVQAFKNKMSKHQDFAQLVQERQVALKYVEQLGDLDLRDRVKKIHQEAIKNLPPEQSFQIIPLLKYAAAIALIVIGGMWFLQKELSAIEVYQQYYEAYALNFGARGSADEDVLEAGGRYYSNQAYENALAQFNAIPLAKSSAKINFAKGISFLETNQFTNANAIFQQLIDQKDPIYEDQARWYLAMSYCKEGKIKEAKALFQIIATKPNSFKQKEAIAILKKI